MNENDDPLVSPLGIEVDEDDENNIITTSNRKNKRNRVSDNIKQNFDKIIIPYDFQKNNYSVRENELEGYEHKEFILNTLYDYNNTKIFKFDSPYSPSCCESFFFTFILLLIILIILYIFLYLIVMFLFNPIFIYFSYKLLKMIFIGIRGLKNAKYEKYKIKAIKKKLAQTNKSTYCKEHNIQWNLGVYGYWLEVEKIKKDN